MLFRLHNFTTTKCRTKSIEERDIAYEELDESECMAPTDTDILAHIPQIVLCPTKWAAEIIDRDMSPRQCDWWLQDKITNFDDEDIASAQYLADWGAAICVAATKAGPGARKSQLALDLLDVDTSDEAFDEWCETRLNSSIGRRQASPHQTSSQSVAGASIPPVINVTVPQAPPPTLDQMDAAFARGADAQKRAVETSTVTGSKYSDRQMMHLQAFCGLTPTTRSRLPDIWTHLQTCKEWNDAASVLTKHFRSKQTADDIPYAFHKELVDDIHKLRLSLGAAPLAETAHRGITPLAFSLLTVQEENAIRETQEWHDNATSVTPAALKASKRKCPSIPSNFDQFERLLRRYVIAGRALFGEQCDHFVEVTRMKQELMLLYRRNGGSLPANTIASLLWDITADAAQFFSTYPTDGEYNMTPPEGMPKSNLAVRRSLISANIHMQSLDTPVSWLPALSLPPPTSTYANGLGTKEPHNRTSTPLENKPPPTSRERGTKRTQEYNLNPDLHPTIAAMMKPIHSKKIPFKVNHIAELAGTQVKHLPKHDNCCFRWMLGWCQGKDNDPSSCALREGNSHLPASAIPQEYATNLCSILQPGVDKFIKEKAIKK